MTEFIIPAQCRAARGLLNWTLADLAEASGLSRASLNSFEQNKGNIKNDTLAAIRQSFNRAGVEFADGNTFRFMQAKLHVHFWKEKTYSKILSDLHATTKGGDEDILSYGMDHHIFSEPLDIEKHIKFLRENNLQVRSIYCRGDNNFIFPSYAATYRWIDPALFEMPPSLMYGNKHVMVMMDATPITLITEGKIAAAAHRKAFEILWPYAKPSTAADENKMNGKNDEN